MEREQSDWVKISEAAEYFGVPRSCMYEFIQCGEVLAVRALTVLPGGTPA